MIVKFDLYNNAGEGPDSTGMYTNRQLTTVPAINLTPTGINLHSGDIFNAQLTYNGTTLTVVITDTVTNATATQTYTVNIPAIVGGRRLCRIHGCQWWTYRHPGHIELDLLRRWLNCAVSRQNAAFRYQHLASPDCFPLLRPLYFEPNPATHLFEHRFPARD